MLQLVNLPKSTFNDNINRKDKSVKEFSDEEMLLCSCIYDYRVDKAHKVGAASLAKTITLDYDYPTTAYMINKLTKYMGLLITRPNKGFSHNKSKDRLKAFDNLINGKFNVSVPNTKYCSDTIHFRMLGSEMILSTVMDFCGRYVICYHISFHESGDLATETLRLLNDARPFKDKDIIFHTDRGTIYLSIGFHEYAKSLNIIQSMGRSYHSTDNAVIENFHRILREDIWYEKEYDSFEALIKAINNFMYYYNYERRTTKEGLTPYEMICNAYRKNNIIYVPDKEIKHSLNLERRGIKPNYKRRKTHI